MRHTSKRKTRRTIGIRGQLLWFLCFICLLLLLLFWFLSTRLLEPLYTTHIQKQLTAQADAIVERLDKAIAEGETLSYWGFGSQLYVNTTFFNELGSEISTAPSPRTPAAKCSPTARPAPCGSSAGRRAAVCGRSTRPLPPALSS